MRLYHQRKVLNATLENHFHKFQIVRKKSSEAKNFVEIYEEAISRLKFRQDPNQLQIVSKYFNRFHQLLDHYSIDSAENQLVGAEIPEKESADAKKQKQPAIKFRGMYIYGGVGTGKSFLMDLLYSNINVKKKRRVHFHQFMLEVHELKKYQSPAKSLEDIACAISEECHLLCFDEFQVTDSADAFVLGRLFSSLFENGTVVIATSNTAPENLYEHGLNRKYFMPFLSQVQEHMLSVPMKSSVDYRQLFKPKPDHFITPNSIQNNIKLKNTLNMLTKGAPANPLLINVSSSRHFKIDSSYNSICKLNFDEICSMEKGAADYYALCQLYISYS